MRIPTARPSLLRLGTYPSRPRVCPGQMATSVRTISKRGGWKAHWNEESLRTTDKYPLSVRLSEKVNPNTEEVRETRRSRSTVKPRFKTATSRHARTQIVSPELCDEALKHCGSSLEVHRGYDILDINPGAGLWSQKLHEFLQPRRHVLMEPSYERFKEFLDPLLDAPGSTYTLVQKPTTGFDNYTELVNEGVFPEQTPADPDDPSGEELNETLLVTGMLAWDPILPGMAFDSMAKQLFNHFSSAVRANSGIHRYGRVRTLFWVLSADFDPVVAKTTARFMKNNAQLEMTQRMELIVEGPRGPRAVGKGGPGRTAHYEIESSVLAMQRARATGRSLPAHREDKTHRIAAEVEAVSNGTGRVSYAWMHDFLLKQHKEGNTPIGLLSDQQFRHHDDLLALQAKYPDVDFEDIGNALDSTKRKTSKWKGRKDHPARQEAHAFALTKSADRALILKQQQLEEVADMGENMYTLECAALRLKDGDPEKDALLAQIADLDAKWNKTISSISNNFAAVPAAVLDDRMSLRHPPHPRLQWDGRAFEPLTMQPDEVWPPQRLSLLSSTPFARPPGQDREYLDWLSDFVFGLYSSPSAPLPDALDRMQHGLAEITAKCPVLSDPDRGGRLQLKYLRVRVLTSEMVEQLVHAYRDWPFKEPGSDHSKYFRYKGLDTRG